MMLGRAESGVTSSPRGGERKIQLVCDTVGRPLSQTSSRPSDPTQFCREIKTCEGVFNRTQSKLVSVQ